MDQKAGLSAWHRSALFGLLHTFVVRDRHSSSSEMLSEHSANNFQGSIRTDAYRLRGFLY